MFPPILQIPPSSALDSRCPYMCHYVLAVTVLAILPRAYTLKLAFIPVIVW